MAEFKTVSLADQVFEKLENDIIVGIYPRGEILTELKLVEQLGVSRTPIREALRRLEQERLIKDSGKGSVVLGITLEDLEDIMNIRQHVEGLAAYYAAQNASEEAKNKLKHISELQDFYFEKRDIDNLQKMDDQFHDALYEMSHRTVLHDTLLPLHRKTMRYRKAAIKNEQRLKNSVNEHRDIIKAIADGNGELAQELMSQHIYNAKVHMIERFVENG